MTKNKKIIVLANEIEANLIESILKDRNIPHLIKSYHDIAFDGLFQFQKGWGHVEAPDSYEDEIKEIYNDLSGKK